LARQVKPFRLPDPAIGAGFPESTTLLPAAGIAFREDSTDSQKTSRCGRSFGWLFICFEVFSD
jgi:hypothetical protein